jgi:hypothetical protein
MGTRPGLQVEKRRRQTQFLEEELRQLVIIMLTGVDELEVNPPFSQ